MQSRENKGSCYHGETGLVKFFPEDERTLWNDVCPGLTIHELRSFTKL